MGQVTLKMMVMYLDVVTSVHWFKGTNLFWNYACVHLVHYKIKIIDYSI
jgi:hypothetical protein